MSKVIMDMDVFRFEIINVCEEYGTTNYEFIGA